MSYLRRNYRDWSTRYKPSTEQRSSPQQGPFESREAQRPYPSISICPPKTPDPSVDPSTVVAAAWTPTTFPAEKHWRPPQMRLAIALPRRRGRLCPCLRESIVRPGAFLLPEALLSGGTRWQGVSVEDLFPNTRIQVTQVLKLFRGQNLHFSIRWCSRVLDSMFTKFGQNPAQHLLLRNDIEYGCS